MDQRGSIPNMAKNFYFATASIPSLAPTQSPVHWVLGFLPRLMGGLRDEIPGLILARGRVFFFATTSMLASVPTQPLSKGYERFFPRRHARRETGLIMHLRLMPLLRMREAVPPIPHAPSWHCTCLYTETSLLNMSAETECNKPQSAPHLSFG
jgi:hypothetical protein